MLSILTLLTEILLSNLGGFYKSANVEIKQKLLGSIFPAKLHFRENYPIEPGACALILQKNNRLENEKTGQTIFEDSLSGELPMTGQLSNHFVEGMRKIYELEPFIKLETLLTEEGKKGSKIEGKKGSKIYKRAV